MDTLLEKSGLYGGGLVPIKNSLLIDRYNKCLAAAGISPTALTSFDIDGKGWSPQIAEEKKDPFYLGSGGAVQFGIVLTLDQKGRPVYRPGYSFERFIMETIFEDYSGAVANLTSRSGLLVEIDPGIARISEPEDILMIKSVTIRITDTAGMISGALEQGELIRLFSEGDAWSNEEIRKKIIRSASIFGDLRFKDVVIPELKIDGDDMAFFYSEDFGGTFTLRNGEMEEGLLVVASDLGSQSLLTELFENNFVEIPLDWYRDNPEALDDLWESILADALYNMEGGSGIDFISLTPAEKKRYAARIETLPKEFFELEKFKKSLEIGKEPKKLTKRMQILLMRPHRDLPVWAARVVWRLISRMTLVVGVPTIALSDLYLYDKPTFFESYMKWPEPRKLWAVDNLRRHGLCSSASKS